MTRERHNVAFLVGVMFGAAGAAVAALLTTPLSGAETRQQLSERVAALRGGTTPALSGGTTPTLNTGTITPTQGIGTVTTAQDTATLRTDRIYSTDASNASATTVTADRIYSTAAPESVRTQDGDTTVTTTRIDGSDRDDTAESNRTFGA